MLNKIDKYGYILNEGDTSKIQPEYKTLLRKIIEECKIILKINLVGISVRVHN